MSAIVLVDLDGLVSSVFIIVDSERHLCFFSGAISRATGGAVFVGSGPAYGDSEARTAFRS